MDDWQPRCWWHLRGGLPRAQGKQLDYRSCTCEFVVLSLFSFAVKSLNIQREHLKLIKIRNLLLESSSTTKYSNTAGGSLKKMCCFKALESWKHCNLLKNKCEVSYTTAVCDNNFTSLYFEVLFIFRIDFNSMIVFHWDGLHFEVIFILGCSLFLR